MAYAQVDTNTWEPYRSKINSWEVTMGHDKTATGTPETYTNWQVSVWLKRKDSHAQDESVRALIEKIPTLAIPIRTPVVESGDKAGEICPFDAHMGKLSWGEETGENDYDIPIATKRFLDGVLGNLEFIKMHKVSKLFYVLGQDIVHAESFIPMTPKGKNILDVDTRFPKLLAKAQAVTIESLYACLEVAPVEVIWVPGNHDVHASLYIAEIIKQHFRNNPNLEVDNSPKQKKVRLWGNLLVGWTHDANKGQSNLINLLPQFWPELWGKSMFREWHTGHKHKKQEWKLSPGILR